MSDNKFVSTFEYKLIYIFRINDKEHGGCLKIGDATIHTNKTYDKLPPNCHELKFSARERIDSYTSTAGIVYELLHVEIAVYKVNDPKSKKHGQIIAFRDHKVHEVLKRSGIKSKYFDTNKKQNEWFITDLATAISAIKAVKENKTALNSENITNTNNPIIFRPEQKEAIKKTVSRFKTHTKMLWNAKMRFGKTLSALQVAKEMGFKRTIIITHRPVVSDGWFEDFQKIFYDKPDYFFGSKTKGKTINDLIKNNNNFVYFASMQDLRGSDKVGGNFDKNDELFKIDWDFVVVDEAHEGTQTNLGKNVLKEIIKEDNEYNTFVLELSGTPFNLLSDFEQESIYTWDYIMEQEAKTKWAIEHFGDSNPYEELPKMNIYTYHLEKSLPVYLDVEDKAFNFREFFRIWTGDITKDFKHIPAGVNKGDFVHEQDIIAFLDLICKEDDKSNYPFSTEEYRNFFRHSLWMLPGVKEAKAFSKLLKQHHIFSHFEIVNVAGDGDEEIDTSNALEAVRKAMTKHPDETYTITLSCGRLTTGVSVPEWTAVLMLSGTYSTAASQYLQTIFRVQTPANINGKIKENCYVFDFAPDRTLKMIAESVQLSARAGSSNPSAELALAKFLNFCPVIAIDESGMKEFKVAYMLQELKKAYAERVARNGFDDPKIYNDELLRLTEVELKDFENLKKIVGNTIQTKKTTDIDVNKEGYSDEEWEEKKKLEKKPKKELTEEEKKRLEELKEKKKNRDSAISILRAISIRIPLMIYGIDVDITEDVTIDNFSDPTMIDDLSWNEFMPKGVTREVFNKFKKYYDKDIFIGAGRRIRFISKTADELEPTERIKKIASLFATFKNPDKETVLTPWRVVNMHLSDTLGGYDFFDENHENILDEPRFVYQGEVTDNVFNKNSNILEINSKTGLYPLYVTYSLYRSLCKLEKTSDLSFDKKIELWDYVVKNNVFVVCKTPMAKQITRRTLVGYRTVKVNTKYFEDLVNQLRQESKLQTFIRKMKSGRSYWKVKGDENMKFDAIIGNPPYQQQDNGKNNVGDVSRTSAISIYQYFVETSKKLSSKYVSLIIPSRWMTGGKGLDQFRKDNIDDQCYQVIHDYENDKEVFPNTDIGGGIMYFLWNKEHKGLLDYYMHNGEEVVVSNRLLNTGESIVVRDYFSANIMKKINGYQSFMNIVSTRKPFNIGADISKKHPEYFSDEKTDEFNIEFYCWDGIPLVKFMNEKYLTNNVDLMNSYKVLISKTGDPYMRNGRINKLILRQPFAGLPKTACSETYLTIGKFDNIDEVNAIIKYIKTKFFRFLVLQKKKTQNVSKDVFEFVPLLDFKSNDINWNLSIEEIDKALYKKFNFTEKEIEYINDKIDYFS